MGTCPKCGKRIKRKRKSDGIRWCPRHGPIEKLAHRVKPLQENYLLSLTKPLEIQ